jgi:antitoxin YefM
VGRKAWQEVLKLGLNVAGEYMETIYLLNADDLNEDFLEGLKASFKHKDIEIVVYERDETAYLLRSPANRAQLLKAIADVEQNRNVVVPDQEQFQ